MTKIQGIVTFPWLCSFYKIITVLKFSVRTLVGVTVINGRRSIFRAKNGTKMQNKILFILGFVSEKIKFESLLTIL